MGNTVMTDDELDDLAAEPDDDAQPLDGTDHGWADADTYDGPCVGGPYAGRPASSRFPRGFLLVDRPHGRAWVYAYAGNVFMCQGEASPLDEVGRWTAAESGDYDVIAYDEAP
jgi:hypothetical protein